jgi:ribonuclease HI
MSKYYAVKNGRNGPNIYTDWKSCETVVKGWSGAIYKSFPTLRQAEEFIDKKLSISIDNCIDEKKGLSITRTYPQRKISITVDGQCVEKANLMINSIPKNDILCYTDGACSGNPGPSGFGVIIQWPYRQYESTDNSYLGYGTNNYAEMYAIKRCFEIIIFTLEQIKRKVLNHIMMDSQTQIHVLTDSSYVVGILSENNNARANLELVNDIKKLISLIPMSVNIKWIPAHSKIDGNERADQLATSAIKKSL